MEPSKVVQKSSIRQMTLCLPFLDLNGFHGLKNGSRKHSQEAKQRAEKAVILCSSKSLAKGSFQPFAMFLASIFPDSLPLSGLYILGWLQQIQSTKVFTHSSACSIQGKWDAERVWVCQLLATILLGQPKFSWEFPSLAGCLITYHRFFA